MCKGLLLCAGFAYGFLLPMSKTTLSAGSDGSTWAVRGKPLSMNICARGIARSGSLSATRTFKIKFTGGVPTIITRSLISAVQPASFSTALISKPKSCDSAWPNGIWISIMPLNFVSARALTRKARCEEVRWRGLVRSWSSSKAFSAFAARSSCCATLSRSSRLPLSNSPVRSLALPASLLASPAALFAVAACCPASAMRASASLITRSWYLFPALNCRTVHTGSSLREVVRDLPFL